VVDESQQKPKVKANVEVKEVMKELKLSLESRKSKQEDLGDDEHNVSSKTGLTKVAESKPGESKDIGKRCPSQIGQLVKRHPARKVTGSHSTRRENPALPGGVVCFPLHSTIFQQERLRGIRMMPHASFG